MFSKTSKTSLILFLVLFGIIFLCNGAPLNFQNVENSIRLGKALQTGDVITMEGYYHTSLNLAAFALENDKCDYTHNEFEGCFGYHLIYNQRDKNFYRRLRVGSDFQELIDRYYPEGFMKLGPFKYVIRVYDDHFESTLDNNPLPDIKIVEPLQDISLIRTFGSAIIESFKLEHNVLPCTYSICL